MQGKCNIDLSFCLADNGFSLDELVFRLGELFEKKAFNQLLRLILMLVQEVLISRIFAGGKVPFECCDKQDFKKVKESEKDEIEKRMDQAGDVLGRLIAYLDNQGYDKAATYIAGARKSMFGYVIRWLKFGMICPRASLHTCIFLI